MLTKADGGIWVLDSGLSGPPKLTAFDATGEVQSVQSGMSGDTALRLYRARIFRISRAASCQSPDASFGESNMLDVIGLLDQPVAPSVG